MSMATRILVVGSANIDLVTRVPRIPKPGESLLGMGFTTVTGGKGANQAVAAARLGAETRFVGCVGNDGFGQQQRESLSEAGVDLSLLKTDPVVPTGTAVIMVAETGENTIIVTPAANYELTPDDIADLAGAFRDSDVVLLQLEIPIDTVAACLRLARATGTIAMLDAGSTPPLAPELLAEAHIVSPNETEAETLTGIAVHDVESARAAAQRLRDWGVEHVVMKLGANGALYVGPGGETYVPAFPVNPVDTVGAGDAFTAALALVWKTHHPADALRIANAAGALATLVHGAQPAMPTRAAVDAFLEAHPGH
jgi:ribokinase